MSHTFNGIFNISGFVAFASMTIVNYTSGGETINASEFEFAGINGFLLGMVPAASNSLGVPLFAEGKISAISTKVKLYHFVSGVPTEIPTTTALNALVPIAAFYA